MSTVASDLRVALEACLASVAGPDFKPLKYLNDLEKNSFTQKTERYGVRPGLTFELEPGVTKALTYQQNFEFVLTKRFCEQDGVSDTGAYDAFYDLHEIALDFERKLINTKAGLPSRVLNVINLTVEPPVFLDEKVTVLTGNFDVIYRLTL